MKSRAPVPPRLRIGPGKSTEEIIETLDRLIQRGQGHDPAAALRAIRQEFPQIFKIADQVRTLQYQNEGQVDETVVWESVSSILCGDTSFEGLDQLDDQHPRRIHAIAIGIFAKFLSMNMLWRRTRGVYQFDPDMADLLLASRYNDKLPVEILKRLPEYCPYLQVDREIFGTPTAGFFVSVYEDKEKHCHFLQFWFDVAGSPSSAESLTSYGLLDKQAECFALVPLRSGMSVQDAMREIERGDNDFITKRDAERISVILPLVLYLCSDEPDLVGAVEPPRFRARMVNKKTVQYEVPGRNREIQVGPRVGAAFRKWKDRRQREQQPGGPTEVHVRPHVRKAHFHGYWTGPLDGERELKMKWLPPIPVNVKDEEELVTTIHPVEGPSPT